MRNWKEGNKGALLMILGLVLMVVAGAAAAQGGQSVGDIATNVGDDSKLVAQAIFILFAVVGFVTAGVGVLKIINAKKTNEPMGLGIGMTLGGALLLSLPLIINAVSQTAVEEDAAGLDELEIGN